jgi:tetratricopeptide (TPR) repeat protein
MRVSTCSAAWLLGAALVLAHPPAAAAQDDQTWQACIGQSTTANDRVSACSAVIDAKAETGRKLAAAYCNRGHGLTENRDFDRALADLNEAVRLDPAYACGYSNRGSVYALRRDLDRAIADYDEAIRIDPKFALAYNNRGDAWSGKGDIERAIADFSAAIKLDPALSIAYGNRGFAYYRKRDTAHAIQDFSTQIKLSPDVLAYINRGNAYRDFEQLDRAAADYAEVIRLAPTDARGWRNRGMIRLYQGDNKGGLADYDKAVQYDPADVYSWNNRGQARPGCGSATSRARSRISGKRCSFGLISARRAKAWRSSGWRDRSAWPFTHLDLQEIRIIRVLVDPAFDERALRDHLHAVGAHLVERALDQPGADALAAEFRRHLGMDEGDDAVSDLVIGRGDMAVDREFVAMMRLVVDDVSHSISFHVLPDQFFNESSSIPRSDHGLPSSALRMSSIFHRTGSRMKS